MEMKVIKIGGNVVDNPELLAQFVRDFAAVEGPKVLIHGGGVMASQMQKSMGMTPLMIEGRRVTDEATLKVVSMVYAGWCNKNIVAALQAAGCNTIGLSGADGNAVRAVRRPPVANASVEGGFIDYGYVGDIEEVNADFFMQMGRLGLTPVVCAIMHDGKGQLLNTNADTVAASIAVGLSGVCEEVELIYCFEKDGVLYDKDDEGSVIDSIDADSFERLKSEGIIADGMIPKIANSLKAVGSGVSRVIIKHARNLCNEIGTIIQ